MARSTPRVAKTTTTRRKVAKKLTTKKATAKPKALKPAAAKTTTTKKAKPKTSGRTVNKEVKPIAKAASSSRMAVGARVPEFSALATSGKTISSSVLTGRKIVLYFYPKDNTPGCTLEGQDFRKLHREFQAAGCEILGVSRDSIKSHEGFKAKCDFPFELLSDPEERLCRLFDVIQMKSLYGRKFEGIERSTFVIDEKGILRQEWRKVKVPGHAQAVLEFVRNELK